MVYDESLTFEIEELAFKKFGLNEFIKTYRPKKVINTITIYDKRRNELDNRIKNSKQIKKGEKIDFLNLNNISYFWYNEDNSIEFLSVKNGKYGIELLNNFLNKIKNGNCKLINDEYELNIKIPKCIIDDNISNYLQLNYYLRLVIEKYTNRINRISSGRGCVIILSSFRYSIPSKSNINSSYITFFLSKNILETSFKTYFNY